MVEVIYYWGTQIETTFVSTPASTQVGDSVEFRVDQYGEPYFGAVRSIPIAAFTAFLFSLALAFPASILYRQAKRREDRETEES